LIVFSVLLLLTGFAVIIKCGDAFVDAAVWIAKVTGLPRLLIGATIVSLATTLPEYFVSVLAVSSGAYDFGISNAIGSVLSNTGLILSLSLIAFPKHIGSAFFYKKAAVMLLSLLLLYFFLLNRNLSLGESIPLFALFLYFIWMNIRYATRRDTEPGNQQEKNALKAHTGRNICKFIFGAGGIVLGARLLADNGVRIAQALQVPDSVISITLVAFGTSLPELVTTLNAIKKKETAMGIGNILGANILNLTLLIGSCALVSGGRLTISPEYEHVLQVILPRTLYIDIPFTVLLFLVLILPPALSGGRSFRAQGIVMLSLYALFILFVILNL
jgi:cation:H+ antiporter